MSTVLTSTTEATSDTGTGTGTGTPANRSVIDQVVSFRLADEEYALHIMVVQEIILLSEITQLPDAPDYVRGLINLRGSVTPIVDLRKRFNLHASDASEESRIVVVNASGRTVGFVVDAVSEVLRITDDQIEPPPTNVAGLKHNYITGIIKMEDKMIILLNIDEVLTQDMTSALEDVGGAQN